jgi:thymidylate synthase|nr:MAG TPA: Thymidylate synthase [Caudoviricetes sp.]
MPEINDQYERLLKDVLDNGEPRQDRTGVGTRSVFGRQLRYNLSKGFPRITTKYVPMKPVKAELLWQLEGSTSEPRLRELGAGWWAPWADQDGDLGPVYGRQMRLSALVQPVKPWVFDPPEIESLPMSGILHHGKDVNLRDTYGVGYYGNADFTAPEYHWLVNIWRQMIRRCYEPRCKSYKRYGARGVHVDARWHCFANFQQDAATIPGWVMKLEYPDQYSLDKDILHASNRYGPDTCMWASRTAQDVNRVNSTPVLATSPNGDRVMRPSIGSFQRNEGLNPSAVHRCLTGLLHKHHGWSDFERMIAPEGMVLRYNQVDQLAQVIASLKHDPMSRRHIINLWSPAATPFMALPPCHGVVIQFFVNAGRLSCSMYQRSADLFLGLPTNLASYALLTHMLAQQTDLCVGELIWTGGDCHIYDNHVEQVKEQLSREIFPFPRLRLKRAASIDDYRMNDIDASEGYRHHGTIKAPVAV